MQTVTIRCDQCGRLLAGDGLPDGEPPPLYLYFVLERSLPNAGWYRGTRLRYSLPMEKPLAFCDTDCFAHFARDHVGE